MKKKKIETEKKELSVQYTPEQKKKRQRLQIIANELNRAFGTIVIRPANEEPLKTKQAFGVPKVDAFTGGGIIHGNSVIIYGQEGCGKSALALSLTADAQKQGKMCAYIDLEHAFDPNRAKMHGVLLEELYLAEDLKTAEEAMDTVIKLAKEKAVDIIIIDSIQAMSPKAEQVNKTGKERSMEEDEMAILAKKMAKFLRVVGTPIYNAKIGLLLIGQIRTQGLGGFAPRDGLSGGNALKHASLLTIYLRKGQGADAPVTKVETEEEDERGKKIKVVRKIGFDCVLQIQKSKTNSQPELSELHIPFYYASGFALDKNMPSEPLGATISSEPYSDMPQAQIVPPGAS